jgi:hypothetical protein
MNALVLFTDSQTFGDVEKCLIHPKKRLSTSSMQEPKMTFNISVRNWLKQMVRSLSIELFPL